MMATSIARGAVAAPAAALSSVRGRRLSAPALARAHAPESRAVPSIASIASLSLPGQRRVAHVRRGPAPCKAAADAVGGAQLSGGKEVPDFGLVFKWLGATALQFALIQLVLRGLQYVLTSTPLAAGEIPRVVVSLLFAFMALRSRVFSPLDNSRPKVAQEKQDRLNENRPSWMPPALVFPIVWSSISVLRTIASVLVWEACGRNLLAAPLAWFLLHLCIGDLWNHINNIQRRKGTSAVFVLAVLGSVYNAVYQYYQVLPMAGYVLAPSAVWLSIATVLIWNIWAINGKQGFFPMKTVQ